jgi:hypothetical protein
VRFFTGAHRIRFVLLVAVLTISEQGFVVIFLARWGIVSQLGAFAAAF